MLLRPATPADIPAMRALDLASPFGARWTDAHYQNFFAARDSQKHLVLIAEVQGDVIAYLAASGVGEDWELENVVVSALNQRRGIGRALMEELLERCRRDGVKRLRLEVREGNAPARVLYTHLGFAEEARRRNYYSDPAEDALILAREF